MKLLLLAFIVVNSVILIYCLPYLINVITEIAIIDAWHFAIGMVMLDLIIVVIVGIMYVKEEHRVANKILAIALVYTIISFSGTLLPSILGVILPSIVIVLCFKKMTMLAP